MPHVRYKSKAAAVYGPQGFKYKSRGINVYESSSVWYLVVFRAAATSVAASACCVVAGKYDRGVPYKTVCVRFARVVRPTVLLTPERSKPGGSLTVGNLTSAGQITARDCRTNPKLRYISRESPMWWPRCRKLKCEASRWKFWSAGRRLHPWPHHLVWGHTI